MTKRKLIIFITFVMILLCVIVAIRYKVKSYGVSSKYAFSVFKVMLKNEKCVFSGNGGIIAHAGGGLIESNNKDSKNPKTYTYTNSKEALLQSINEGFKFVEIDLMLDSNGEIFGAHDYESFYEITNDMIAPPPQIQRIEKIQPPSSNYILNSKIYNKFTPLTLKSINEIFLANPQIYLVTDKLNDFKAITSQLKFKDRILVEVFSLAAYYDALNAGIKYPMLSSSDIANAMRLKMPMMAMHTSVLKDSKMLKLAKEYIAKGGCIATFSSNDKEFIDTHLNKSATFIYADFWDIKQGNCKLPKEQCTTY